MATTDTSNQNFANALQHAGSDKLALADLISAANAFADPGQARQLYHAWIERNQDHPQLYVACFNCAALDAQAQERASAVACLEKSIALKPDFAPAYINLGRQCEEAGAPDRAVELWRRAANLATPVNGTSVQYAITALTQMARVLSAAQQAEKAEEVVRQCLDINPRQPEIVEQYSALRLAQCKWPMAVASGHLDRATLLGGVNPLSMAAYTDDPLLQLASAYRYVKRSPWDAPHDGQSDRRDAVIDLKARRLRVGYVSSDLRDHAIGYLMAEMFELHDRNTIEVFAYYCGPESHSALTGRIKSAVEHWVDIRALSDDAAAARVAADGIDVLVDVNGHTRDSKTGLFARRPAPIQINWLGYPGSMGTPYHQYLIADDWIIPPSSEIYYSEKVVRLPCYQPNDRKRGVAAEPPSRESAGLPQDAFVYCCFNGSHKISRFTFERWMEILKNTGNSVLWLLDASDETKARLRSFAEEKAVAGGRLIFAPKMANAQHLARYPLADLFLDSAPYGAHTTASDALWMGVPVLTLSGRCFASRVCGSLVRSAGLGELVCSKPDEYVARAIALANNRSEIQAYKTKLGANRDSCTLFDTGLLVRSLEALYRGMCDDHGRGLMVQPDLANLDVYFEAGIDHDHDGEEVLKVADYHGMYLEKLKRSDRSRPLSADSRLWRGNKDTAPSRRAVDMGVPANTQTPPSDIESLRQLARELGDQGRTLECLDALLALKAAGASPDILIEGVRAAIEPTLLAFNRLAAAGQAEQAAQYADALAALLPDNVAALNSALSCSVALGRKSRIEQYAGSLIRLDPAHRAARDALTKPGAAAEALHPLIQLRDLYDQASAILCSPLTEQGVAQIRHLQAAAAKLDVAPPKDSEIAGWEKHYRLAMRAIDISQALKPTPGPSTAKDKIQFATAQGKALSWRGVQDQAKRLRAKAVFFAAADRRYVDLYGRVYIESILDNSDVSSLIVLHVIGGAKDLPAIAKSLGIASNRLVFAGDMFDTSRIKTKCYDAPPKGLAALPLAHLQSVRFLKAGALLEKLKLPLLVSDIDLVLQRGVKDMLETFKDCDVVLNENNASTNAGSHFTANLLLLHPTKAAALFLRFTRSYLEKALGGSEVTRWIDQFALIQAWHHLAKQAPKARIGYFDVNSDINNLIYTSYQEHPYRFLSLYHGFDMSTLPGRSKAQAKPAPRNMAPARGVVGRIKRAANG